MKFKILDSNHQLIDAEAFEFERFFKDIQNRRVGHDTLDGFIISTVFLGVDHGFHGKSLWFETMIFLKGSSNDLYCDRYETWDEAMAGHQKAIQLVESGGMNENNSERLH